MRATVVVLVIAACTKSTEDAPAVAPRSLTLWQDGPAIAMRWITERPSWHTPQPVDWIVPVGDRVVIANERGWIAHVDGATGAVSNERDLDVIHGLVDLGNGRVFALVGGKAATATVLDAKTLATLVEKPLPASNVKSGSRPSVARVPNGALVIALPGEPLALYDPTTFKRTRVLVEGTEWTDVKANASSVYASRPNPNYSEWENRYPTGPGQESFPTIDARIHSSTGEIDESARLPFAVGPDRTYQPNAGLRGFGAAAVFRETSELPVKLDGYADGVIAAFAPTGDSIAVEKEGGVSVYSTLTGKLLAAYPIVDRNFLDPRKPRFRALSFVGSALYVAYDQEIRVVDLEKQTTSPVPAPPSTSLTSLLVSDSGEVQTIDRVVARFVNGKRTTTSTLRGDAVRLATPSLGTYGSWESPGARDAPYKLVTYRDGKQLKETPLAEFVTDIWVTSNAAGIAWNPGMGKGKKLVETLDGVTFVRTGSSTSMFDVDPDAQIAITDGRVLDLKTGVEETRALPGPCESSSRWHLEPGGSRVATWHANTVWLYDRTTRKKIASMQLSRRLEDAPIEVRFLRGTTDLVIRGEGMLALWSPADTELRTITTDMQIATSPDGKSVGFVTGDGRVGLTAYATMRAAMTAKPAAPAGDAACQSELVPGR